MLKNYVKVLSTTILKETIQLMHEGQQTSVLVVDAEGLLEGILTLGEVQRRVFKMTDDIPKDDSAILDVHILDFLFKSQCFPANT
ncbi:hypothetical protein GIB67_033326 [Kingdonia uniflora]|uniref:CBS domain-containing protein n=1 Tax=Kingdonia uniflora TaxID=39325 RepID=A0A7J7LTR5_9MAGN|nr:hypothetical protein GIB67_033326 [Kingdonia uniflora]